MTPFSLFYIKSGQRAKWADSTRVEGRNELEKACHAREELMIRRADPGFPLFFNGARESYSFQACQDDRGILFTPFACGVDSTFILNVYSRV